jgi:hypothetical protein
MTRGRRRTKMRVQITVELTMMAALALFIAWKLFT